MLSLIKAHCFKIKGDWYLVYPLAWSGEAWFLPASSLRRYIRYEILLAISTLLLMGVCLYLADNVGKHGILFFLFGMIWFVVSMFAAPWYLGSVGGQKSNFDEDLLKTRGMDNLIGVGHGTVQIYVLLWFFLLSIPFVTAWRMPYVWEHNDLMGVMVTVLVASLALAAVWWVPRAMLRYASGISLADIDPPTQ